MSEPGSSIPTLEKVTKFVFVRHGRHRHEKSHARMPDSPTRRATRRLKQPRVRARFCSILGNLCLTCTHLLTTGSANLVHERKQPPQRLRNPNLVEGAARARCLYEIFVRLNGLSCTRTSGLASEWLTGLVLHPCGRAAK